MDPRTRRLLALGALAVLAACVQDDGSRFNPIDSIVPEFDEDVERKRGMEFDRQIEEVVTVIHDPIVAGFLTDLGVSIVTQIDQPFIYRFRVVDDPSLNAFAVPGGYIYFHSGTLLAVSSLDELAGVMGHEIAHVKARHHFRMAQQSQVPDLLAALAGAAAAVATGEPGILLATQAVNVAVKLRYGREFETEADRLGGIFAARAGYDPGAIARFFERLEEQRRRFPNALPPYLFTHPDVGDRIAAVEARSAELRPTRPVDPAMQTALLRAQQRLALLEGQRRQALPGSAPPADRSRTDPLLAEAEARAASGDVDAALLVLARAQGAEPHDPRVPFRIGELLQESGRPAAAIDAYRRTVELDPTRALVFFKLGQAYKQIGDEHHAVYAFEQAKRRAGPTAQLRRRAQWEIVKLIFTLIAEDGFADGSRGGRHDTPLGTSRESFRVGDSTLAWWARLGPSFVPFADRITVRWCDPAGEVVQEESAERLRKPFIGSVLELDEGVGASGSWSVEVRLEDDVIQRRQIEVLPAGS